MEIYINLCSLLDRLIRRNEGFAADYLRLSLALQSLAETSESTYAVDTSEVPLLNAGLEATARHLSLSQSLLEDESKAWDGGVLEDLKRQRDALVSVRDMFDRRDRLAKNNIPALERRIENNTNKLANLRSRPEGTVKPGEIEKVEEAIVKVCKFLEKAWSRMADTDGVNLTGQTIHRRPTCSWGLHQRMYPR